MRTEAEIKGAMNHCEKEIERVREALPDVKHSPYIGNMERRIDFCKWILGEIGEPLKKEADYIDIDVVIHTKAEDKDNKFVCSTSIATDLIDRFKDPSTERMEVGKWFTTHQKHIRAIYVHMRPMLVSKEDAE